MKRKFCVACVVMSLAIMFGGCVSQKTANKPKEGALATSDRESILRAAAEAQEAAKGVTFKPTK